MSEKENELPTKKHPKTSNMELQKSLVKEYELDLKTKHEGSYSVFQYKLWAEMYAKGAHTSLEEPPAVAMLNREVKLSKRGQNDLVTSVIVML